MPNRAALIESWKHEELEPFSGWDFSHVAGRALEENPPWNYLGTARSLIASSRSVLDMATGGGEIFSSLGPFPGQALAIEGHPPNVAVAQARLGPLGIKVIPCGEAGLFPFSDAAFDLVLNRHGGCWSPDLGRITQSQGHLLTQQVGGDHGDDLLASFGTKNPWPENSLPFVSAKLEAAGFQILQGQAWEGLTRFKDVGALVYSLKAAPWLVQGFSVASHLDQLMSLQARLERQGELAFKASKFFILAKKR